MLRRFSFLLLLPLLCAVPTAGRRSEAYFSLSTNETFLPGDKVSVRLSSSGVNALEFRVYKVNDPAAFFERLADPHNFGTINAEGTRRSRDAHRALPRLEAQNLDQHPQFLPRAILR